MNGPSNEVTQTFSVDDKMCYEALIFPRTKERETNEMREREDEAEGGINISAIVSDDYSE